VILEEILMHEDEPADLVHDVFTDALFPGHPLGREILGEAATIEAMTRDDVRGYFGRWYRPDNIVVAVAGNADHDAVAAGLDARYTGPEPGADPERANPLPPPRPLAVFRRPTEQAHVVAGMRALARDDPDRFTLSVVNQVLGGGMSSRLFQEIREKRGLAYSVYSYRASYAETGALAVYAGTAPSRAHEVLGLIATELDRMVKGGITARELEVAKGHLTGSLALGMEDSAARMSRIGRSRLIHGEVQSLDDVVASIERVTADDTARVIERVLGNERVVAVVGPFDETDFARQVA
jgi:predicted Zn-dependent peptidase